MHRLEALCVRDRQDAEGGRGGAYKSENWYLFDHYDYVLEGIGAATGVSFSRRRLTRSDIRRLVDGTKKPKK